MTEADTPWTELASRVVRVALTRKNFSYAELSTALHCIGVTESERSLASRVSRGRIKAQLLLQIFTVTHAKVSPQWQPTFATNLGWERKVQEIIKLELARHPTVTFEELAQRMVKLGAELTEKTLVSHLQLGTLSLPELLQCLVALGSSSLELYIDYDDMAAAAAMPKVARPHHQNTI